MRTRLPKFPVPFTVGNDICHIPRILKILRGERTGPRFVKRILAPEEMEQPWTKPLISIILSPASGDAEPAALRESEMWRAARFMAGRFAVKEAVFKAHPHRKLTWHRIVIDRLPLATTKKDEKMEKEKEKDSDSGPPLARIRGDGRYEDTRASVSISHDGEYAVAVCVGCYEEPVEEEDGGEGEGS
ncbi:hypothetical protein F4810DRAFT_697776 [Camillea tinctor]|nr:hypothetical protein F4810DRAFT_697776 [Camillea tinctor]